MEKIRIFIGSSANGEDKLVEAAYEYTLRKNTDRDLEIIWMRQTNDKSSFWSQFNSKLWDTPFSGFRWGIPEYCNFEGRAIYTDVDMLNFHDIGDLYDLPMFEKPALRREGRGCVMLFDCSKFKNWGFLPKEDLFYHQEVYSFFIENDIAGYLSPTWNSIDGDVPGCKQLHYSRMPTQPWRPSWYRGVTMPHDNPELEKLFWDTLEEARNAGYHEDNYDPTKDENFEEVIYPVLTQEERYMLSQA